MARMIEERKELDSGITVKDLLERLPIDVPLNKVSVESEQFWEYGEGYHRLVIAWKREETENERLIRERADKLRRDAAAEALERKEQEEYVRLSRKYGTSA